MGGLIVCPKQAVRHPYYVESLGIHLYSAEELSYFIYNHMLLLEDDFPDERLLVFIGRELGYPRLEDKLRNWVGRTKPGDLLLVILQDLHYYSSGELFQFRQRLEKLAGTTPGERLKARGDYLLGRKQYYGALRTYDKILALAGQEMSSGFLAGVWYSRGNAFAGMLAAGEAMDSFLRSYELVPREDIPEKMFALTMLDETVALPEKMREVITPRLEEKYRTAFEEKKRQALFEGQALEAALLQEKTQAERAQAYKELVENWKNEYRRAVT